MKQKLWPSAHGVNELVRYDSDFPLIYRYPLRCSKTPLSKLILRVERPAALGNT